MSNIAACTYLVTTGLVVGLFTSRQAAEEHCQAIHTAFPRQEDCVLLGK